MLETTSLVVLDIRPLPFLHILSHTPHVAPTLQLCFSFLLHTVCPNFFSFFSFPFLSLFFYLFVYKNLLLLVCGLREIIYTFREIIYTFLMVAVQVPVFIAGWFIVMSAGSFLLVFPFIAPCIIFVESLSLYQLQKLVKAGVFGLTALKNAVEHPDEIDLNIGQGLTEYFGSSTLFFVRWFYMFVIFFMFTMWIVPERDRTEAEYLEWTKQQKPGTDLESGRKMHQIGLLGGLIFLIGSPLVAWFTEPFTTNSYIAIGSCLSLILIDSLFQRFVCPTPAHEKKK